MNKQKGFSAVILLLVLLLLVAVGFTGYYVWNTQNNKNKDVAEVAPATETKQQTPITTTPAPVKEEQKYLVIKEWGVKIPLSEKINDLTYRFNGNEGTVTLKTAQLIEYQNQLYGSGNNDLGGIGLLSQSSIQYRQDAGTAIQHDGPFLGYYVGTDTQKSYILLPPSQSSCPENNSPVYKTCMSYEQKLNEEISTLIRVVKE
jgi:hypothetical protein